MERFEELLKELLEKKEKEMCDLLNEYMNPKDRYRIGEDIIRGMPNMGDIATIKMKIIDENNI